MYNTICNAHFSQTYIMEPNELVRGGVCLNVALKVDVVPCAQVVIATANIIVKIINITLHPHLPILIILRITENLSAGCQGPRRHPVARRLGACL